LRYFTLAGINGITKILSKNQFATGSVGMVAAGAIGTAGTAAAFSFDGLFSPLQIQHLTPSFP
jgi:hypothetical protein